jgi:hypothetical protein
MSASVRVLTRAMVSASRVLASLSCLRIRAAGQQAGALADMLGRHVQFADQLALPFDWETREVHGVAGQDRAEMPRGRRG